MRTGFYSRLALRNITKNYRFFIPRVIAEAGLLGVYYIVYTLKSDERLLKLRGGMYLGMFMSIGTAVMILLSAILLLYINGFLMKQRKREFGLYSVLGMEKRHVGKVLFFESLFTGLSAIILGLAIGMLFYKICSLLFCRLLGNDVVLGFYFIKADSVLIAALFFAALDLITYLFNRISIARMKPVDMLKSSMQGEREPRVRWALLVLGVLALGGGYYISLTTQSPLKAIMFFFLAVILVIVGTYFLFVSGSIFVLKLLKRNERFYYKRSRMAAVSGLLYRMKQNAVGLASIAILATGVLVMISTTVSLYSGMTETLDTNYPQHYYVSACYNDEQGNVVPVPSQQLIDAVYRASQETGVAIEKTDVQLFLDVSYNYRDGRLYPELSTMNMEDNLAGLSTFTFITEDTYYRLTGERLELRENEAAVCSFDVTHPLRGNTLGLAGREFSIVSELDAFPISARMVSTSNCYGMVVSDETVMETIYQDQLSAYGAAASNYVHRIAVTFTDVEAVCAVGEKIDASVYDSVRAYIPDERGQMTIEQDSLWKARESTSGMYGSLLFLGILLGMVCLFATALIIYYKQISEGYEDRGRFQIMQKIGMSVSEVRRTINVQILLVFFLPLLVSGVHLIFAFPILEKLLHILLLSSTMLFIKCSVVVCLSFALVYVFIYLGTARTYFKIVH